MQVNVNAATPVLPAVAPANSLDPLSGAGVGLTKIVLLILSAALCAFLAFIFFQEYQIQQDSGQVYLSSLAEARKQNTRSQQENAFQRAEIALLRAAADNSQLERLALMNSAADELDRLTANKDTAAPLSGLAAEVRAVIAQGEKKKLAQAKLNALVLKIQLAKSSALPSAQAAADSDFKEIVKHHADAANASREHWMKVAQMVLLNLLLPVLTALLGYVFASRNSGR